MIVELKDVCNKDTSNIRQKDIIDKSGDYPIYGASGLVGNVNFYQQEKESVAVVKDGAGIGRVMLLPAKASIIGTMQYLIPKENILPEYLYYAVRNMHLEKYYSGATIPHIYFKDYQKEKINLVSLKQQREIVTLFNSIENVINKKKNELSKLDTLIKARFVEMFGDIKNNQKYNYKQISSFTNVASGGTPKRDVKEYWDNGTIPWIKTTELKNKKVNSTEEYITKSGLQNSSAKLVPAHTILIAMYGQGKTRGMTAYLEKEAATNQACACILPSSNINSEYLWQYLIMSYNELRNMAKGGNQPNLNSCIIKNFPVLYPPVSLQNKFASFVQQVDKSKVVIQKSLDETQTLFDSLMQKHFS
ncbi:restriction endonuclease subunit S [uncultured Lactobacillus sp.]|uniref:restriction endonuclease subunit S n=1 Tax=uncultured Lactobacillus sp. TaxID=153152 RepID=UPI002590E27B|nr:restriction endonuclease subunit S [uncultured Lactobacillus sp.]